MENTHDTEAEQGKLGRYILPLIKCTCFTRDSSTINVRTSEYEYLVTQLKN